MAGRFIGVLPCLFLMATTSVYSVNGGVTDDEMMCNYHKVVNSETKVTECILDCQGLLFQEVPEFKSRRTVDKLLLGRNQIKSISNEAFKGISPSVIDLHGNMINTLKPDSFKGQETSLKSLNLSVNSLKLVDIDGIFKLQALETLDLHDNSNRDKITLPKGMFKGLKKLKYLNLRENGIRTLNKTLQGLSQLQYLDLGKNKLTSLGHSLGGLKKLETLDVSSNNLRHFPKDDLKDVSKLTELNLSGNRIKKIPDNAFSKIESLKRLWIGSKYIKGVETLNAPAFGPLAKSLIFLDLSKCHLDKTPNDLFKVVTNLETLDVSSNKIGEVMPGTFSSLKKLKVLKLGSNTFSLSDGIFTGLENTLKEIFLNDLRLQEIPSNVLGKLSALERLVASSNDLVELSDISLSGLSSWRYDFSKNDIAKISPKTFNGARKPVEVDLRGNKLESLDFATEGCRFSFIDVSENPITCDCSILELVRHADLEISGTCSAQNEYRNLEIAGSEFRDKASGACNRTNAELVYCNVLQTVEPSGIAPSLSSSSLVHWSLFITVLIQAIGVRIYEH